MALEGDAASISVHDHDYYRLLCFSQFRTGLACIFVRIRCSAIKARCYPNKTNQYYALHLLSDNPGSSRCDTFAFIGCSLFKQKVGHGGFQDTRRQFTASIFPLRNSHKIRYSPAFTLTLEIAQGLQDPHAVCLTQSWCPWCGRAECCDSKVFWGTYYV